PETTYSSIGPRWANVANTPYQLWKEESYEGGIHTPMIAFWPKGITAKKGSFNPYVGHVMDFMSTFTALAGAKYPAAFNGHQILPTSGISMVSTFSGKQTSGHEELFNEHFGARYARLGNWKLVSRSNDSTWHLFNLANDKSETIDLKDKNPEMVQQLQSKWHHWANTHQVFPKPGRKSK
ncbi:MAG: arylsulfatase, partial [Sphingobacteriaceae bacterium]